MRHFRNLVFFWHNRWAGFWLGIGGIFGWVGKLSNSAAKKHLECIKLLTEEAKEETRKLKEDIERLKKDL